MSNYVVGLDLLTASGNAKIVNLASNLAALVVFLVSGQVVFALAIPAAAASMAGSFIGARLALKNGIKIIRPVFIFVLLLLLIRVGFDLFFASGL